MSGHYVLIGVADTRSHWFSDLTRWSTSGLLAAEYIKALSVDESRAILASGRRVSALIVGSTTPGLDREFVALARSVGAQVVVVESTSSHQDWDSIGVACVLPNAFGPDELTDALRRYAKRIDPNTRRSSAVTVDFSESSDLGKLIAVTGTSGTGVSTIAMALAQGLGASAPERQVALADLTRSSDLAMYNDVGDIIPGLPELVEAHRGNTPDPDQVRDLLFSIPERSYSLLLGQRRSRDSAAMGPLSTAAAIDGLRRSFDLVVTDVDPTLDGETETGSLDIEMFNAAQRHATSVASLVLVVTTADLRGYRRLARTVSMLHGHGVEPAAMVPVLNHAPRSVASRASMTRLVAELNPLDEPINPVVFVRRSRFVEDAHNSSGPLPQVLCHPVTAVVDALLEQVGPAVSMSPKPLRIAPLAKREKVA